MQAANLLKIDLCINIWNQNVIEVSQKGKKHLWFQVTDYSLYFPAWFLQFATQQKYQHKNLHIFQFLLDFAKIYKISHLILTWEKIYL